MENSTKYILVGLGGFAAGVIGTILARKAVKKVLANPRFQEVYNDTFERFTGMKPEECGAELSSTKESGSTAISNSENTKTSFKVVHNSEVSNKVNPESTNEETESIINSAKVSAEEVSRMAKIGENAVRTTPVNQVFMIPRSEEARKEFKNVGTCGGMVIDSKKGIVATVDGNLNMVTKELGKFSFDKNGYMKTKDFHVFQTQEQAFEFSKKQAMKLQKEGNLNNLESSTLDGRPIEEVIKSVKEGSDQPGSHA